MSQSSQEERLVIKRLELRDLPLVLALQDAIHRDLDNKEIFQLSTEEFIRFCLTEGGLCYATFLGTVAVAYRMIYFPGSRPNNLGLDLGFPTQDLGLVAHWDTVGVLPAWRGMNLAYRMSMMAISEMHPLPYRHLCSTTSPYNPYGLESLLKVGFRVLALKEKYGGKLRFICHRPFPNGYPAITEEMTVTHKIPLDDISGLSDSLADGCQGVSISLNHGKSSLCLVGPSTAKALR